jgi:diguanylate cyclase (GGDEF)-like protein
LDLDNFKEVNDKHGHVVGDMVLREAAKIINENIRNVDKAGRYGGDEFILLLPETPLDGAKEIGERIRGALQYAVLYDGDGCIVRLTTSLGIATLPANSNHIFNPSDWLIKKADEALYRAKRMGGNLSSVEETFS